ncbi:ATP-grasp domain-containing protein [Desulforamulus aeronauticus]|uniref:Biotin carboxylase n=1 Tax=Desulforamulus aeronauticus DSM 10349 TaxID=1121421 RepID=A0A1M6V4L8_9FIRM|nr:ATP-grasp domain-containing protein [Desulforamulus aeronauticus]SHK76325.1 Biotin carboxylase [Desulforamulus aeronauticus DSM 10349]
MRRVLVIGAAVEQLPAITRAKELGYYVGVVDFNSKAVGIPYADVFYNCSTIDENGVLQAARDFRPDCVLTLATDRPIIAVAKATTVLGLPGISMETAIKATDKAEMIKAFQAHGVAIPWFLTINRAVELEENIGQITYPCILKPVDNAASRGVILVYGQEELAEAYAYSVAHSHSGRVIVEEYLQGNEVSVEIIVDDGVPHVLAVTDKLTTGAPHFVELGHSQPCALGENNVEKIKNLAVLGVKAVGINCGPAHVEIMLTKDGPKMMELGARLGGDCITSHLVRLSTGINMLDVSMDVLSGEKPDLTPKYVKGSAIRFLTGEKGIFRGIDGVETAMQLEGIQEVTLIKKIGDTIHDIHSSDDRVGFVIAQAENATAAVEKCETAKNNITFC